MDLGAYKILSVNVSPKGILDVYICPEVLRAANLMLIHKTATEIVALDKQNKRQYKIKNSLGVIQPFINQRLKDNGFKALNATFKMGSRDVNEIAVFDDHILADISPYDVSGHDYSL